MTTSQIWTPFEAPIPEILAQYPEPLMALARGEVPAFVLRQHYNPAHCRALMRRFYERSLLYDPHEVGEGQARRVDIGTPRRPRPIPRPLRGDAGVVRDSFRRL
ncbi:MAG: hypothetical protein J4F35_00135 [Candidatus Latescibacteria bacterium]|nr:hypothetical protein [Candidatus Latescibacterota bacterium]